MICISNTSSATNQKQNEILDSLISNYNTPNDDEKRIDILLQLITNLESNGILQYKNKTIDEYLKLTESQLSDSINLVNLAQKLDSIGVNYRKNGYFISALKFHNWANDISVQTVSKNQQSIILNNIGVVYRRLDDYQTALSYHIKALELAEEINNLKSQAVAINSMGNIQMLIGNLTESLEYFKQSLLIEQKQNSLLGIAINLNNIGNVYNLQDNYTKSLEYYFLSLDINKEINSSKGIAICYNDIGNIYERIGEHEKALNYYLDALTINFELNDKYGLANSYLQVGELYADIGQNETALEYLQPGLKISLEIGSKASIMNTYRALYEINRASNNLEEAINYLQLFNIYNDSITNVNVRKDIARLQIKYESERKENLIELLEQNAEISDLEIKRQKTINWLILSAFIIALGAVISLIYYLINKNKTNKLLLERNKIIEKTKAELDDYSKQLLIAKHKADDSNRAKSEFLANMSHEIRTPLNSVIGFTELLSTSTVDNQQLNHLKIIKSSGRTLLTIINDILDLSKIQAGKFTIEYENTNIEQIIVDVMQMFSHRSHEKDIKLVTNIQYELPQLVLLSELRLRQILFNLIGNAINYTNHGSVTIKANYKPSISNDKINLVISITDTGIGIKNSELESIFDPFNQSDTNKTNNGTGLGLTITKRLVEIMNGTITVSSVVNKGTTFTINFPDVKVVKKFIGDGNKAFPMLTINKHVRLLLFSSDLSDCQLLNLGNSIFTKNKVTQLQEAKKSIINKNLIIICGFSDSEAKNALNILYRSEANYNLKFVIISDNKPNVNTNNVDVTWVNSQTPINTFVNMMNDIFTKIAYEENSKGYFNDLQEFMLIPNFNKSITQIYNQHFTLALETKMLNNINTFINALQSVAKEYNSEGMTKYCSDVNDGILNFEIEKIDVLLNLFDKNYQKIK